MPKRKSRVFANDDQLRLLLSLHKQLRIPYDPAELALLDKWEAAERINVLRGRPSSSSRELDVALMDVLQFRTESDPSEAR